MKERQMDLTLGVEVYCADDLFGQLTHLVLNPKLQWVTHLVVKDKSQKQTERVLSVKYIEEAATKAVHLNCAIESASIFQPFEVIRYKQVPGEGSDASIFWSIDRQAEHHFPTDQIYTLVKTRSIPLSEVVVNQNTRVEAIDGAVGRLRGFQVNSFGWEITHLIFHRGHLWGQKEIEIPVSEVQSIAENTVRLKLNRKTITSTKRRLSRQVT
jgi:hypothetical protein